MMVSMLMSNEIRYLHYLLFFCYLLSSASELVSQDSTKMMVNVKCTETERQALLDVKRDLIDIMVVFLRGATATMAKIAASGVVLPVTSTLVMLLALIFRILIISIIIIPACTHYPISVTH